MTALTWKAIKALRPNPPQRLTVSMRRDQLAAKAAARLDRAERRELRKLRGRWAGSWMSFPDGCEEEYDKRGHLTAGAKGPDHHPAAHAGVVTPYSFEMAARS